MPPLNFYEKKVLITGGTGFVGRYIVNLALKKSMKFILL